MARLGQYRAGEPRPGSLAVPRCVVSKSGPGVASAAGEGLGPELGPPEAVAGAGYLGAGRNGAARVRPEPRLRGGQSRGTAAGGCWAGDAGWGGPGAASWRHLRGPLPCIAGAGHSWPCCAQPLVGELMVKSRRGLCLLTGQQGLGTAAQRLCLPRGPHTGRQNLRNWSRCMKTVLMGYCS